MKKNDWLNLLGILLSLAAIVWWSVDVYRECRETNSASYCLRLVSR